MASTRCSPLQQLLRFAPALLWAALIFWCSAQPRIGPLPHLFVGADKVLHLAAYSVLTALLLWAAGVRTFGAAMFWSVVVAVYGASDEIHQLFVPTRSADALDWLADVCGALLTGGVWLEVVKRESTEI